MTLFGLFRKPKKRLKKIFGNSTRKGFAFGRRAQPIDPSATFQWSSSATTHIGLRRSYNEDAFLEWPEQGLWIVADGMGGHTAGDVASRMIIDALRTIPAPTDLVSFEAEVRQRLNTVNQQLRELASRRRVGIIGSTVVAVLAFERHFAFLWAGDSRAYLYRRGELRQLTHDHSQVAELVAQGLLPQEKAAHHPAANVITRAIGADEALRLDSETAEIADGDVFLLCSDGLNKEVSDREIASFLAREYKPEKTASMLVDAALERGARDNVTVLIARAVATRS